MKNYTGGKELNTLIKQQKPKFQAQYWLMECSLARAAGCPKTLIVSQLQLLLEIRQLGSIAILSVTLSGHQLDLFICIGIFKVNLNP